MGQGKFETTVQVGTEFLVRRPRGRCQRADDQLAPCGEQLEALTAQVAQPALDPMSDDGAADGTADHEPHAGPVAGPGEQEVHDDGLTRPTAPGARDAAQVVTSDEAMLHREHGRGTTRPNEGRSSRGSDREALAALAASSGQDRAARAGAHAQPEPVRLVTAAVVRLVRTLAHEFSPMVRDGSRRRFGQIARWRGTELVETQMGVCGFGRHRPPTHRHPDARRSEPNGK